jgi:hypothetical protein
MRLSCLVATVACAVMVPSLALGQEAEPPIEDTPAPVVEAPDLGPPDLDGGSSYGQFLAGRAAMNRGDGEAATAFLAQALTESAGARLVRERTFSAAVLAGEIRVAAAVPLEAGESHAALVEGGRLARIAQAIARWAVARGPSRGSGASGPGPASARGPAGQSLAGGLGQ